MTTVDLDELEREGIEWDHGQLLRAGYSMAAELRTLRARVGELESENARLLDENEQQHSSLCDETNRAESAEARVKELEAERMSALIALADDRCGKRITDLESQLAAAREEQGLEAKVREVLGERFELLEIRRNQKRWQVSWWKEPVGVAANAPTLPALLRAILDVEKGT